MLLDTYKSMVVTRRCIPYRLQRIKPFRKKFKNKFRPTSYEGWNFNSGNYIFTTDTK